MIELVLLLANTVVVFLGGLTTSICFRAYRQNNSFSMLCMTMGFPLIAAGSMTGAFLLYFSVVGFWEIQTIQAAMIAFGFAYIAHSIFSKKR